MKQTFTIPEGCKTVSVEQVGNQLITTFEPIFKEDLKAVPKAGDCVRFTDGDGKIRLFIVGDKKENGLINSKGDYISTALGLNVRKNSSIYFGSRFKMDILTKEQFQSEVNALGFEYDFDTDIFKELKWKPEDGEPFYCFDYKLETTVDFYSDKLYNSNYTTGNCFKTESECESAIEKIKETLKQL